MPKKQPSVPQAVSRPPEWNIPSPRERQPTQQWARILRPKWTTFKPRAPGWYWGEIRSFPARIYHIGIRDGRLTIDIGHFEAWLDEMPSGSRWHGPLKEPVE